MGEREGSSLNLTDSGRTPLAVLLGDTGEIERDLDAALGRLTTSGEELEIDRALAVLDELHARRQKTPPRRPPERRHHQSAIAGRIHSLAEEAYLQEVERRQRREEPSGRLPILAEPPPLPEELVAELPWALRQHLVRDEADRNRPFVLGAMIGAAVAVLTAITFVAVWTLTGWGRAVPGPAMARVAAPAARPQPTVAPLPGGPILAPGTDSLVLAGTLADPLGFDPSAASAIPLTKPAPQAKPLEAKAIAPASAAQPVKLAAASPAPRRPRVAKAPLLAPKATPPEPAAAPQELGFEEEDAAAIPAAAAQDDGPPPPSQQDLDDAFEREFGAGSAAAAAAPKRTVFVPPPVAELPAALSEAEILQTVIRHKAEVAGCVEQHAQPSEERRRIVLEWVIAPDGAAQAVQVASPGPDVALGGCIVDAVKGWKFSPHREPQNVRFPFSY